MQSIENLERPEPFDVGIYNLVRIARAGRRTALNLSRVQHVVYDIIIIIIIVLL